MLAGDLGINLTVISDYHGAKDPDELIQKDPALWQQAVAERVPAVDWLLAKYEENLNLRLAPDKKQYSDVALKLLGYVKDEVERAAYEQKVADKLGVEVGVLREKGARLDNKLAASSRRVLKKPKTEYTSDSLKKLVDSLLALKVYGGIVKTEIPFEMPEDEARLGELELIFNREHEVVNDDYDYEAEAAELMARYEAEIKKQKIADLTAQLAEMDEDDLAYEGILREIRDLQSGQ